MSETAGVRESTIRDLRQVAARPGTQYLYLTDAEARSILALLDGERDALDFIAREGYRRCDIPACNCGSWHGGHASERLGEIADELDTNGVTILNAVKALRAENDSLRAALAPAVQPARPDARELIGVANEMLRAITSGRMGSMGGINTTYLPQIDRKQVEGWRAVLNGAAVHPESEAREDTARLEAVYIAGLGAHEAMSACPRCCNLDVLDELTTVLASMERRPNGTLRATQPAAGVPAQSEEQHG